MDRDKALQYFKQLGFNSQPLSALRRQMFPQEMVIQGDALTAARWHRPSNALALTQPEDSDPPEGPQDNWTEVRAVTPLLHTDRDQKKETGQLSLTAVTINTVCSCHKNTPSPGGRASGLVSDVWDNEDSDLRDTDCQSDSDEEGLTLDKLLSLLERQQKRAISQASGSTLARLVSSFLPADNDPLCSRHLNQLQALLARTHSPVQAASLGLLQRVLEVGEGEKVVQRTSLVNTVMDLMMDTSLPSSVRVTAMGVMDKMLNMTELDYEEIRERVEVEVYPSLVQCLHGKAGLEEKYAACCVVRSLARDAEFAARIKKESLFLLQQLRDSSARIREVYVGVLMALFTHPGLTEEGSVDMGVVPVLKGLLRDGPCDNQRQGLELLQCVLGDRRGMEGVRDDHRMVAYVMACLLSSQCRKVRQQACVVASMLTSLHTGGKGRALLEAIGHYVGSLTSAPTLTGAVGHYVNSLQSSSPVSGVIKHMTALNATATTPTPTPAGEGKVSYPVPAKKQAETVVWHQLDAFLQAVALLLKAEALISGDGDNLHSELPVKGEISGVQLSCLSYLLQVVLNICLWPLHRRLMGLGNIQLPVLDVTHLTDDVTLRKQYSSLNHALAVQQWQRFGRSVFAVLRWLTQRNATHLQRCSSSSSSSNGSSSREEDISSTAANSRPTSSSAASSSPSSSSSTARSLVPFPSSSAASSPSPSGKSSSSGVSGKEVLTEGEWTLLLSVLHLVLGMTLVTCRKIPDPLTDTPHRPSSADHQPPPSQSGSGSGGERKRAEPYGLWVKANPHLTPSSSRGGPSPLQQDGAEKLRQGAKREACSNRRRVRREMLNEGLFPLMALCLQFSDPEVKTLCYLILRTAVQPLEEKTVTDSTSAGKEESAKVSVRSSSPEHGPLAITMGDSGRSQSAVPPGCQIKENQPHMALCTLPPTYPANVKDTVGSGENRPGSARRPVSAARVRPLKKSTSASGTLTPNSRYQDINNANCQSSSSLRPLAPGQPINRQCLREAVLTCGGHVMDSLFCRSRPIKLHALTFLYDLTRFTSTPLHMELSKCGIVPKLLDFLRVNEDDEHLEILALRVLSQLLVSDLRLQQLFSHHGGHLLLTALLRNSTNRLREQIRATMATVTKGRRAVGEGVKGRGQRPFSAPVQRGEGGAKASSPPRDIWDHIMQRWAQEDQVVKVLRKFMHKPPSGQV